MKRTISWTLPLLFLFVACERTDHKPTLIGQWQGVSWTVNGNDSGRDAKSVHFKFDADDTYFAGFGSELEKGTYRLSGNKLYTTGENQIEKMVKLSVVTPDSIVMDMNRAGQAEVLTLVKL